MEFSAKQIASFINGRVEGDENATVNSFAKIEEGVYILQDKPIYGTFKIGDLSWSKYDYGSNGTVPVMGETADSQYSKRSCH